MDRTSHWHLLRLGDASRCCVCKEKRKKNGQRLILSTGGRGTERKGRCHYLGRKPVRLRRSRRRLDILLAGDLAENGGGQLEAKAAHPEGGEDESWNREGNEEGADSGLDVGGSGDRVRVLPADAVHHLVVLKAVRPCGLGWVLNTVHALGEDEAPRTSQRRRMYKLARRKR